MDMSVSLVIGAGLRSDGSCFVGTTVLWSIGAEFGDVLRPFLDAYGRVLRAPLLGGSFRDNVIAAAILPCLFV
jgi:hypothetical protein